MPNTTPRAGQRLTKGERICRRTVIDMLFQGGSRSFSAFPIRAVCRLIPTAGDDTGGARCQALVSVSKRRLQHAVDRNRVKRQLREAYRKHKPGDDDVPEGQKLLVAFIWTDNQLWPTGKVEQCVDKLLRRINEKICTR